MKTKKQLKKELEELKEKYEDLLEQSNRYFSAFFYLQCHPEHLDMVLKEQLYGIELKRDIYGHVVSDKKEKEITHSVWYCPSKCSGGYMGENNFCICTCHKGEPGAIDLDTHVSWTDEAVQRMIGKKNDE